MDILEELKQQKEALQEHTPDSEATASSISSYQYSILVGALKKIHDYLHELTNNLNQLNIDTNVEMLIPQLGSISNLGQVNYNLVWENNSKQNNVHLNFKSSIRDICSIDLNNSDDYETEKLVKNAGADYKINNRTLVLAGNISSSISFCINPDDNNIILILNNFISLGKRRYAVDEKLINENFFDQFGRFLLHRENNFIDIVSSALPEQQGPDGDEDLEETDSGIHTQELDISRVRSLFSKEVQLYLTYHNSIKEMSPSSDEFIIGRSRQCGIVVNSDLASRQHAKIVYRKGKYVLIDTSTNGTFVKTQGGKEVYVQREELPLSGSGFISLGKSVTVDNEHIIYFSCQ
ncbi:MAG: FHA domain-containing protein [Gammaproteobacteria bacterium]|nr:FHA domain-containing protein [Gammaproteobacteria bacterium]